jgi:hypothetical protein
MTGGRIVAISDAGAQGWVREHHHLGAHRHALTFADRSSL